jgi:hypothetical protein
MQQRIPATDAPFKEGKKIPMNGIDNFAFVPMSAEVGITNPDLQPTPRERLLRGRASFWVRIVCEGNPQSEPRSIASKSLPTDAHYQFLRICDLDTKPAFSHPYLSEGGTSRHPTG